MEIFFYSILYAQTLIILVLVYVYYLGQKEAFKERHDLYDRLMSRSFVEYKDNVTLEPNLPEEAPDETIGLEQAREELEGEEE